MDAVCSLEPLLGPINMRIKYWDENETTENWSPLESHSFNSDQLQVPYLNWVIVGGESGTNARPMNPSWARSIRDQCQAAKRAFFFKQWGEWVARHTKEANSVPVLPMMDDGRHGIFTADGQWRMNEGEYLRYDNLGGQGMFRVGKKVAGRLLDGREWNEMPLAGR